MLEGRGGQTLKRITGIYRKPWVTATPEVSGVAEHGHGTVTEGVGTGEEDEEGSRGVRRAGTLHNCVQSGRPWGGMGALTCVMSQGCHRGAVHRGLAPALRGSSRWGL